MIPEPFLLAVTDDGELRADALYAALAGRGRAQAVAVAEVSARLDQLLSQGETVVLAARAADALAAGIARTGVLPVLVDAGASEGADWLAAPDLSALAPLFGYQPLQVALELIRLDPAAVETVHRAKDERVLSAIAQSGGVHIFGAGTIGQQVLNECRRAGATALGFVDNSAQRAGQQLAGLTIRLPAELSPERDTVVVAVGNHARTIATQLAGLGFVNVVNLSEFFHAYQTPGQPEADYLDDLWRNRVRWIGLALALADPRSREVLAAVVRHRLTLDVTPLAEVADPLQWFDAQFLRPDPQAVFVDGGAFDGDTAEAFIKANGPARRVHAFELDPEIAERARVRLADHPFVTVHAAGLSDQPAELRFVRTGVTDGRLAAAGDDGVTAQVVAVDDVVAEPVTFLKLDVEGADAAAIAGAARQIRDHAPLLALAVYHKAGDVWALPAQVAALRDGYRLYLRHYTQVAFETVIYAVPGTARSTVS